MSVTSAVAGQAPLSHDKKSIPMHQQMLSFHFWKFTCVGQTQGDSVIPAYVPDLSMFKLF